MTNVADNWIIAHLLKVLSSDDVFATSSGYKNVGKLGSGPIQDIVNSGDLITFHWSLQGIDGIYLGDHDTRAKTPQGSSWAFAHISIACHKGHFTGQHDVGSPLDTVTQGFATPIQIVKLGLGDRVIDVDGRHLQLSSLEHLVQVVNSSGSLLRQTTDILEQIRMFIMDQLGQVTAIIQDHVQRLAIGEKDCLPHTPDVFVISLSLPSIDRHTPCCHGGGSVVLGGENVARRPSHLGSQLQEGLD